MEQFIKIEIEAGSPEEVEILIAELSDIEFNAFEENKNVLNAYIPRDDFDEKSFRKILPDKAVYKVTIIENRNWNEDWESGFQPVYINLFAGIRASFHEPLNNVNHEIIITPKMSFGTGHHATTYLMIEQMENINFMNKTVTDFGTGTGVLAILAEKLGAKKVIAIDHDEWSINNANENIKTNNCKLVTVAKNDTVTDGEQPDIILANINLNILLTNSGDISRISKSGNLLLMSGFFGKDKEAILTTFNTYGFTELVESERENWASLLLIKD